MTKKRLIYLKEKNSSAFSDTTSVLTSATHRLNFGVPSQILHPEGVVDVSNLSQPVVHYHLKDQASTKLSSGLGNVRGGSTARQQPC
ncbi:MAG: hypothetical protein PHU33_14880 [Bacteroidales bacterium]|nr:hypothetical protein [Bacteroidales bacterium]